RARRKADVDDDAILNVHKDNNFDANGTNVNDGSRDDGNPIDTAIEGDDDAQQNEDLNSSTFSQKKSVFNIDYGMLYEKAGENNYFMVHSAFLKQVFNAVGCPTCSKIGLQFEDLENKRQGLNNYFHVYCSNCESDIFSSIPTSVCTSNMSNPDVNSRMVLAMRNIGVGYAGMQDFCRTFNMKGLAVNTYTKYVKKLKDTCEAVVKRTLNKAAQHVRSVYEAKFPELKDQRIIDVAVTYDGTWHRRGRTSHYSTGQFYCKNPNAFYP
ncbi:uncharacterized protein LOC117116677, partial [Anneissia japonica]|uniref:uncharacterized protein LOC117116677 n=1 Tax=Anneissia japonica TaxID=1529436 RepID=UPI001425A18A